MNPWEREIRRAARNVARLQGVRRQLKKRLKDCDANLRVEQRHLRALVSATVEQSAPSHLRPEHGLALIRET